MKKFRWISCKIKFMQFADRNYCNMNFFLSFDTHGKHNLKWARFLDCYLYRQTFSCMFAISKFGSEWIQDIRQYIHLTLVWLLVNLPLMQWLLVDLFLAPRTWWWGGSGTGRGSDLYLHPPGTQGLGVPGQWEGNQGRKCHRKQAQGQCRETKAKTQYFLKFKLCH